MPLLISAELQAKLFLLNGFFLAVLFFLIVLLKGVMTAVLASIEEFAELEIVQLLVAETELDFEAAVLIVRVAELAVVEIAVFVALGVVGLGIAEFVIAVFVAFEAVAEPAFDFSKKPYLKSLIFAKALLNSLQDLSVANAKPLLRHIWKLPELL